MSDAMRTAREGTVEVPLHAVQREGITFSFSEARIIVGASVTTPGVLRPTTRAPVLVCSTGDRLSINGGVPDPVA